MKVLIQKANTVIIYLRKGVFKALLDYKIKQWHCKYISNKWKKIIFNKKVIVFKLANNINIYLYADDVLSEAIFSKGFEINEQKFIYQYLHEGDIFIDIGANIGLFTLIGANLVGETGKVFAFEPAALTNVRLHENVKLNNYENVQCVKMAISDKTELRTLTTSIDGYGAWNSLAHPTAGNLFEDERVQCITLDKFASENGLIGKVALMKIDVEGWELYALKGGIKTLSRSDAPDLLVEFTDENAKSANTKCQEVFYLLTNYGYTLYNIDSTNKTLGKEAPRDTYPFINLLATKRIDFVSKRTGYRVK